MEIKTPTLKGYRTYITLAVLALHQILNALGFTEYTGEQISSAIDVLLAVIAFIFRWLATAEPTKTVK